MGNPDKKPYAPPSLKKVATLSAVTAAPVSRSRRIASGTKEISPARLGSDASDPPSDDR